MSNTRHLLLVVPQEWATDDKGNFYEGFVQEILRPMRFRSDRRLRVTGMELDILAKGEDTPTTVLVECKAQRDPVAADVITKLIGNVQIRHADAGWLFTTSDLTKDGRGLWEEIQNDENHARKFTWYSPLRTIEVLIAQRSIVDPTSLIHHLKGVDLGDWSLIVTPGKWSWLVEILEDGLPTRYSVFDARAGHPLSTREASAIAAAAPRYSALQAIEVASDSDNSKPSRALRTSVARVISGDAWDDPRPARPTDFVGRDDAINDIAEFVEQVRQAKTATRSFAVLAPSGWGKSSLALMLAKRATNGSIESCSLTAVDSRSATSAAFVAEALRLALKDATQTPSKRENLRILSLREPLDSPDITKAIEELRRKQRVVVLLFDQFEELFAKEPLFEVFNAVRDLTLDVDARQVPLILGFAWKTDVSLPQQHPAYHLWHQLGDRRRTFKIAEFGRGEIERVVSKAEKAIGKKLSKALRSRLAEQCQGFPWLLKKLLVHVLQRVSTPESQYLLLERELDIEQLFKEDLEQLQEEHLRCLKFVASRAPVPVADVEENFSRDTTNLLINQHLLVRSGMNYVVYWDIFRDYLVEERVPEIPWARTFQRMPPAALKALSVLNTRGPLSAPALGKHLALKEGPTFNVLGDLVALQLVDSEGGGVYRVARHLTDLSPITVATAVRSQLRRHVVTRAIERTWPKEDVIGYENWNAFFRDVQPRTNTFSLATRKQYAATLKSWLVFAGLLELRRGGVARVESYGAQMGQIAAGKSLGGMFLGTSAPARLEELLFRLYEGHGPLTRDDLERNGFRNALADGIALGLVDASSGQVALRLRFDTKEDLIGDVRQRVSKQPAFLLAIQCLAEASNDRREAAKLLAAQLGVTWKVASAIRYLSGLLSYAAWTSEDEVRQSELQIASTRGT